MAKKQKNSYEATMKLVNKNMLLMYMENQKHPCSDPFSIRIPLQKSPDYIKLDFENAVYSGTHNSFKDSYELRIERKKILSKIEELAQGQLTELLLLNKFNFEFKVEIPLEKKKTKKSRRGESQFARYNQPGYGHSTWKSKGI